MTVNINNISEKNKKGQKPNCKKENNNNSEIKIKGQLQQSMDLSGSG